MICNHDKYIQIKVLPKRLQKLHSSPLSIFDLIARIGGKEDAQPKLKTTTKIIGVLRKISVGQKTLFAAGNQILRISHMRIVFMRINMKRINFVQSPC